MEADIKAAIEKNLPSAVGDVLRKRLDEADKVAAELAATKAKLDKTQDALNTATKLMVEKEDLDKRAIGITVKEAALAKAELELNARKEVYELHKSYAAEAVKQMERVVLAVFANARLKSSVLENGTVAVPMPGYNGGSGYVATQGVTSTKTTETEVP